MQLATVRTPVSDSTTLNPYGERKIVLSFAVFDLARAVNKMQWNKWGAPKAPVSLPQPVTRVV